MISPRTHLPATRGAAIRSAGASALPARPRWHFSHILLLLPCCLLLAGAGCVSTGRPTLPGNSAHATINLVNNLPFVEVDLGGKKYNFLVDTGASDSVITPEIAAALGIPVSKQRALVRSAAGDHVAIPMTVVPVMRIGNAEFRNFSAFVYDCEKIRGSLQSMDGVVGFSLFRDSLLTLDYPRRQMVISPWSPVLESEKSAVPMRMDSGVPRVPLISGENHVFIDVDSGSTGGLEMDPHALGLKTTAPPQPGGLSTSISKTYRTDMARVIGPLFLGPVQLDHPIIEVTKGDARVGGEILRNLLVTFDQRSRRTLISFGKMEQFLLFKADRKLVSPSRIGTGIGFDNQWVVRDVVPESPAAKAGVKVGDLCVAIQGEPTTAWDAKYSDLLREETQISYRFKRKKDEYDAVIPVVLQVR